MLTEPNHDISAETFRLAIEQATFLVSLPHRRDVLEDGSVLTT